MMQDISDQFERVLTMLDIPRQHKFSKEETKVMVSYVEEVMDMAEENFQKCKGLDKDGEFKEQIDSAEENEENIKYMLNQMSLPFYVPEWVSEKEKEEEEIKERKEKKEGESEEKKSEKEKEEHVKEEKSS